MELMVVITIIGVLIGAVGLSLGMAQRSSLKDEVERFRLLMGELIMEARLGPQDYGLAFESQGYHVLKANDDGSWSKLDTPPWLQSHRIPQEQRLTLDTQQTPDSSWESTDSHNRLPDILVLASGEVSPFSLTLRKGEPDPVAQINVNIIGRLTVTWR